MFTKNPKRKIIILALLALAGIGAAIGGSFAAYTSQAYKRGVVRNRDNETVRFTSNYLQACAANTNETDYAGRTILFDKNQTASQLERDIYIYNYASDNENLVSQKDIKYDLTIKFSGGIGSDYRVNSFPAQKQSASDTTDNSTDNNVYTYEEKGIMLVGRSANSYKYTIKFPASDLDRLKITVIARPTSSSLSATNNQMLAAVIAPCTASAVSQFTKQNKYVYKDGTKPMDYDAFNYEVSISSGKANAVLTWNTKVVEIDRFFLVNLGKTDAEIAAILAAGTLNFEMDQAAGTGDYLIPFYIKDKSEFEKKELWTDMKVDDEDIISFDATPEASGETDAS